MGKIITTMYYPEPLIEISGKYCDEISLDKIREIKQSVSENYGFLIYKIQIRNDNRKDGILTDVLCRTDEEARKSLFAKHRDCCDYSHVIFCPTPKRKKQRRYKLFNDGTFIKETA